MKSKDVPLPKEINILSKKYKVVYTKNLSDVDENQRELLFGIIDPLKRTIRIYNGENRSNNDIFETLIHEIIHGVHIELGINMEEQDVNLFSVGLFDALKRNNLLKG